MTSLQLLLLAAVVLPAPSQVPAELSYTGGVLGGSVSYTLAGPPGDFFVNVPSFSVGPTPLGAFFPGSPLVMGVGTDLLFAAPWGILPATPGATTVMVLPLPAQTGFLGVPMHAQAVTFTLSPFAPNQLSSRVTSTLGLAGMSHFVAGVPAPASGLPPESVITPRRGHTATVLDDGRVLIAGGETPDSDCWATATWTPVAATEIFDPQTEIYTQGPSLLTPRKLHRAVKLTDGSVLIVGGIVRSLTGAPVPTASVERYDPSGNLVWSEAPMNDSRAAHTVTLLQDGRVWTVGGAYFDVHIAWSAGAVPPFTARYTTEIYDPTSRTWSSGPSYTLLLSRTPVYGHTASRLPSGRVLVTGGIEMVAGPTGVVEQFSNRAQVYDPVANTLTEVASVPMPAGQGFAAAAQITLPDGRALLVGGFGPSLAGAQVSALDTVHAYDETSNSWTAGSGLNTARLWHYKEHLVVSNIGSSVHVLGGITGFDSVTGEPQPAMMLETVDLATLAATPAGSMRLPRFGRSVAVNGGTRILTVGVGRNGTCGTPNDTVDRSSEYFTPR